ncbi:MAG: TenA family protein [Chloroflexota bacterium]|nr:TenA family protein [Chloroflexota bacterium]
MTLTVDLKEKYSGLWANMVHHPFVNEMGIGTLPPEKFRRYFLQDYVFVKDLVTMSGQAVAKAPDMESASVFNNFLGGILDPENDLFVRAFKEFGASSEEYSSVGANPTTQAFGDFVVRTAVEGTFDDIALVLFVTEGTYLDWGSRLLKEGANPDSPTYREWIYLHSPEVLGSLVRWLEAYINHSASMDRLRADYLFKTTLRYEYLFWEAAYSGNDWFDS